VRGSDLRVNRIATELALLRKRVPEATIFLATDNQSVQERFRRDFSGVFLIDKTLGDDANSIHEQAC
jgi:hypothetical protein